MMCINDLNAIPHSILPNNFNIVSMLNVSISQKSFSDETISKLCDCWLETWHKENLDDKPHSEQELFSARHINSVCSCSVQIADCCSIALLNWKF